MTYNLDMQQKQGNLFVVMVLLEKLEGQFDLTTEKRSDGMTALICACHEGHTDVVQLLLKHPDVDLNAKGCYGSTPFLTACSRGHKDIVQLLLKQPEGKININEKTYCGQTAFILACHRGQTDVVQLLLEQSNRGIDFNAKEMNGMTAFNLACGAKRVDVVELLLKHTDVIDIHVSIEDNTLLSPHMKAALIKATNELLENKF